MATLWHKPFQSPQRNVSTIGSLSNHILPTTVYCTSCAYKFPDRSALEDHACPAVSFICTCGMGFSDYKLMLIHRNDHSDMTSLQTDHVTIMKKKFKDAQLQEKKLQMLEHIDRTILQAQSSVIPSWRALPAPFSSRKQLASPVAPTDIRPSVPLSPPSSFTPRVTIRVPPPKSSPYPHIPVRRSAPSKSSTVTNMPSRVLSMQPIGTTVPRAGAIVNLTLQFQPAVVIRTKRRFHADCPFLCAICGVIFWTKKLLVEHVTSHSFTQVHGCLRCGRLLIGNTPPSSQHYCGMYCASHRDRFTSGHFFNDSAAHGQKQISMSRCPHCPSSFFKLWHLHRHIKTMHSSKYAVASASVASTTMQLQKFPSIKEIITERAVAPVQGLKNKMLQQSVRMIAEMKGWNVMNGMLKTAVPDGKRLQQSMANMPMAKKSEPETPLETNTCVTGLGVAQRETLKVVQRVGDLKPQCTKAETVIEKQAPIHCRCVICGKNFSSTQMLGQHLCKRKLTLLRQEKWQSMPVKSTGAHRSSLCRPAPYSLAGRDSEEMVTVLLQTSHGAEMHEPVVKNIPSERSRSPLFKSVAVQTKVEFDDGSYDAAMNSGTTSTSSSQSLSL